MRLAILSALADPFGHAGASAGERPAFRRFAGKSVLAHQIDCAAHLACDRVICLSGGASPDMGAAKTYAERAGVRFDLAESTLRLASQITADDEVLVLADGVLPDRTALVDALAERPGVLAFSADPALALGFERLDAERAWSGALRMRGAEVARLADLPLDCDLASSLLRIALQSGVRVVELDAALLTAETWQRRVDRNATADTERRWIAQQVQPAPFVAPGLALADRMAVRWARDAGGGRWARAPHLTALLTGLLALGATFGSWPLTGLALLLAGSFALAVAAIFDQVEALGAPPRKPAQAMRAAHWLRDGVLIGLLAMLISVDPNWLKIVLPLAMVAILHLGAAMSHPDRRALYGDRIVLLAVLLGGAWLGWTAPVVAGVALLGLAEMLWATRKQRVRITTD